MRRRLLRRRLRGLRYVFRRRRLLAVGKKDCVRALTLDVSVDGKGEWRDG